MKGYADYVCCLDQEIQREFERSAKGIEVPYKEKLESKQPYEDHLRDRALKKIDQFFFLYWDTDPFEQLHLQKQRIAHQETKYRAVLKEAKKKQWSESERQSRLDVATEAVKKEKHALDKLLVEISKHLLTDLQEEFQKGGTIQHEEFFELLHAWRLCTIKYMDFLSCPFDSIMPQNVRKFFIQNRYALSFHRKSIFPFLLCSKVEHIIFRVTGKDPWKSLCKAMQEHLARFQPDYFCPVLIYDEEEELTIGKMNDFHHILELQSHKKKLVQWSYGYSSGGARIEIMMAKK